MSEKKHIYKVTLRDKTVAMVRAGSKAKALGHVANAEIASQDDLVAYLLKNEAATIEDAK